MKQNVVAAALSISSAAARDGQSSLKLRGTKASSIETSLRSLVSNFVVFNENALRFVSLHIFDYFTNSSGVEL
jgi:hypothetical protein